MASKPEPFELVEKYLKLKTANRNWTFLLGVFNTHCKLISCGVRDVATFAPYWDTAKHRLRYPKLQRLAVAYELKIQPRKDIKGRNGQIYWEYFIYSKDGKQKVKQIIELGKRLATLEGGVNNPQVRAIHREIGRLFGYSERAISRKYPKSR